MGFGLPKSGGCNEAERKSLTQGQKKVPNPNRHISWDRDADKENGRSLLSSPESGPDVVRSRFVIPAVFMALLVRK
jgi:hypothetical protein